MSLVFHAFGIRLGANVSIPGLTEESAESAADVWVQFGSMPAGVRNNLPSKSQSLAKREDGENGRPEPLSLPGHGRGFRLRYDDGTVFVVDTGGTRVWATWQRPLTLEDTAVYLLGPVLAFVLRLRGTTCLHASAISVGGRTVALVGPSGAGKSTTAAAFAARGFAVLTDDMLALDEQCESVIAHPGYPRLRLWPDAARILGQACPVLPRLTPNWDKRYLDLRSNGCKFEQMPRSLAAIYLLDARSDNWEMPFVESMTASAALFSLLGNVRGDSHSSKNSRRREFDMLAQVVRQVPVRRIVRGTKPHPPAELCELILEDFRVSAKLANSVRQSACTI
jgi:energy-coupling factor transporter ATP-binding protein EcfA2